jgi:hypothetical protein
MMFLYKLFFFTIYCSSVFIYGTGIRQTVQNSEKVSWKILIQLILTILMTLICILIINPIVEYIVKPYYLKELIPLVILLVILPVDAIFGIIKYRFPDIKCSDLLISYPILLLSFYESVNLTDTLTTAIPCIISYYLFLPLIYAVRKRITITNRTTNINVTSLIFISIAVILCAFLAFNYSWLSIGVLK